MTISLDLSNLREALDGDAELEKELFKEFIESSQELIEKLSAVKSNYEQHEEWRIAAHALKGISQNLGAFKLGEFCKNAQEQAQAPQEEKSEIFNKILNEHQKVIALLQQEM